MCTGLEIAALIGAGASAATAIKTMSTKAPQIQAPEKPPQPTKAPDRPAIAAGLSAGVRPGGSTAGSTFLTGPTGIGDEKLNLGKNTLLGQ